MSDESELHHPYISKRYICSVFGEMREALKPLKQTVPGSYRHLKTLIEEAQTLANRMEHALEVKKNHSTFISELKRGKDIIKQYNKKIKELKNDIQTQEQLLVAVTSKRTEGEEVKGWDSDPRQRTNGTRECGDCDSGGCS